MSYLVLLILGIYLEKFLAIKPPFVKINRSFLSDQTSFPSSLYLQVLFTYAPLISIHLQIKLLINSSQKENKACVILKYSIIFMLNLYYV